MAAEPRLLCRAKALYPYTVNDGSSLHFERGDTIEVLAQLPSGWWDGLCGGKRGWFPSNYVEIIQHYLNDDQDTLQFDGMSARDNKAPCDLFLPTSPQSKRATMTRPRYDQHTQSSSPIPPTSDWSLERKQDTALDYYYPEQTLQMLHVNSEDPILFDEDDSTFDQQEISDEILSPTDPRNDLLDFVDDRLLSSSTVRNNKDGTDEIDFGGDWMDNDENAPQLPPPWIKKSVAQGGTCYYNMATHEVAWDINDIMDFTHGVTVSASNEPVAPFT
ncbi:hypothetical protein BC941DRAFT_215520 [Chlamydoabsidia padenii]|nr:hypothetical protein BC941DRAFT_215520 [Chlamydoabsidia padenii]